MVGWPNGCIGGRSRRWRLCLGPTNGETEAGLLSVADVLRKMGKVEEATDVLQKACAAREGRIGLDEPRVV